jgi:hypothetical protein
MQTKFTYQPITAMPPRNDPAAPRFNSARPRELPAYFEELELLLRSAGIQSDQEKKAQVKRYIPFDDAEFWTALPEYGATETYAQFREKVMQMYPGASGERHYTVADMEQIVAEHVHTGIHSVEDLGEYHWQFYTATKPLVDRDHLSPGEQSHAFIRGFQPALWEHVAQHLESHWPDHFPDDPYELEHNSS